MNFEQLVITKHKWSKPKNRKIRFSKRLTKVNNYANFQQNQTWSCKDMTWNDSPVISASSQKFILRSGDQFQTWKVY